MNSNHSKKNKPSYAQASKKQATPIEDEKHEVKRTNAMACNLIIHGVSKTMIKTKKKIDRDDKDYVECRIKYIEIKVNILKIERLRQFTREKKSKDN